jgi:hypothetical protein
MVDALWMFGKEELSDAQLVIVEEGEGGDGAAAATGSSARPRTRKRSRADSIEGAVVLPIHKIIVMSASEFFKAKLSAWQSDTEPCRVVLHVPPGQVEIGRRLVRAMYEAAPSFDDISLEQRFQLWGLADRYGAPKVAKAAAAAVGIDVSLMAKEGLAWAAVLAAYPEDLEEDSEASSPPQLPAPLLRQYAADALQELFGDLEAVWAVVDDADAKLDKLLSLPFAALKALLADERTRVASENTVVHTIVDWFDDHELEPDSAQAKELLALVRVARLTPHYARTVFCESELARKHLSAGERAHASMLPMVGDEPSASSRFLGSHWRLPARPRSAFADAVVLEWCPRLAEIEACFALLPAHSEGRSIVAGPKGVVWQGWPLYLQLHCGRGASSDLTLEPSLAVEPPCRTAGALIGYTLEAAAASGGGGGITSRLKLQLFSAGITVWRSSNFFGLGKAGGNAGPPKDWAGVEAALRAKRLVHGGRGGAAHLKLRCTVTRLE